MREPSSSWARKFEAWNRQLHVRIGKVHDGIEQRHRQRLDAHLFQRPVEAIGYGLIDQPVVLLIDRRVLVALHLRAGRRQADKMRRAVVAAPVQERRAAEHDRRPFRPRPEQHRQHAEQHVVANDDVGRETLQNLLQTLMLRGDDINEHALHDGAQQVRPRRHSCQFGEDRIEGAQIQVGIRRKRVEFRADAFDAIAQDAARQEADIVAFVDQDVSDCKQRIEMARRGRRSKEDFHGTCHSGCRKAPRRPGCCPVDRLNQGQTEDLELRLDFATAQNGYGCNA